MKSTETTDKTIHTVLQHTMVTGFMTRKEAEEYEDDPLISVELSGEIQGSSSFCLSIRASQVVDFPVGSKVEYTETITKA